jgi:hypothetical protein
MTGRGNPLARISLTTGTTMFFNKNVMTLFIPSRSPIGPTVEF